MVIKIEYFCYKMGQMKTKLFTLLLLFLAFKYTVSKAQIHQFPQQFINQKLKEAKPAANKAGTIEPVNNKSNQAAFQCIQKMESTKKIKWEQFIPHENADRQLDTVYVGASNTDTLVITGNYTHQGPIFVFNQGVLIIHNATMINEGDIYVFGEGKLLCDSSSLTFPQQYFYQRGLYIVHHATAYFSEVNFNYSGMQHNLVVGDSATLAFENVHQSDWTTAGLYGKASLFMNGMNLGGEYILTDSSTSVFKHVDTLLLWHKFPQTSVIDHSFPQGDTVYNYYFSNLIPNIAGVDYVNFTDSCYTVWWGIMPVNGSDVTLHNSNIRVSGAWFQFGDSLSVTGIQNNTFYPNTLIPLADRTLNMLNTFVQTWSFYVFDSSYVAINNCTLGEVGTQQTANVVAQNMLLDGTGGYFWATDTSFTYAVNVTSYSTTRSEKNGIFLLAYSEMPFAAPTATGSSLVISAQNNTAADPVPYDGALAWNQKIESPDTAQVDDFVDIVGSAWINQGPNGSWMDFQSYSLYYQLQNASTWTPIVIDSLAEVSQSSLGVWNTNGLIPGNYILRQVVKNNLNDSIETFVAVVLLPGVVSIKKNVATSNALLFPNPANESIYLQIDLAEEEVLMIEVYDVKGQLIKQASSSKKWDSGSHQIQWNTKEWSSGMYMINIIGASYSQSLKFTVQH